MDRETDAYRCCQIMHSLPGSGRWLHTTELEDYLSTRAVKRRGVASETSNIVEQLMLLFAVSEKFIIFLAAVPICDDCSFGDQVASGNLHCTDTILDS